ncbi:MAG: thermonuclease family protein [Pseudomonadota bacterium]
MARISRRHLHMLLAGKFITVIYRTLTPRGNILGQVLHGGVDINLRMIEAGMARVYPEGRLSPGVLLQYHNAERSAQARKLGLWQKSTH